MKVAAIIAFILTLIAGLILWLAGVRLGHMREDETDE